MTTLTEQDVKQAYIGKPCNAERFSEIFNKANTFYCGHCDEKIKWKFDITPALYIGWEQRGIDFKIRASAVDGVISHCGIIKYKDNYSGLYVRSSVRDLKPTQQELRLFQRILEYVTTDGDSQLRR
jgi:hypothetical protein